MFHDAFVGTSTIAPFPLRLEKSNRVSLPKATFITSNYLFAMLSGVGARDLVASSLASAVSAPTAWHSMGTIRRKRCGVCIQLGRYFASALRSPSIKRTFYNGSVPCFPLRLSGSKRESWMRPRNNCFREHHTLYAQIHIFLLPAFFWRFVLNFWGLLVFWETMGSVAAYFFLGFTISVLGINSEQS